MYFYKALSFLLLSLLDTWGKADEFSFRSIPYKTAELELLNTELQGLGNTTKYLLEEKNVISVSSPGYGDAVFMFHTLSSIYPLLLDGEPLPCRDQVFGKNGQWTETVCDSYIKGKDLCAVVLDCDVDSFPKITAGKAINLADNKDATIALYCLPCTLTGCDCPPNTSDTLDTLHEMIQSIPNKYDNIILSNAHGMAKGLIIEGVSEPFTDPNSHYTIGDGKLSLYDKVFQGRRRFASLRVKDTSGPLLMASKYNRGGDNSPLDTLIFEAVGGLYAQRYAEHFFTTKERKTFLLYTDEMSVTQCGPIIGIVAATKCGYDAEDLVSFLEYYDSLLQADGTAPSYCSLIGQTSNYLRARRFMTTHQFDRPNKITGNKKYSANDRCMKKLMLYDSLVN